jgi:ABC-type transporter Mla subunit MlaD
MTRKLPNGVEIARRLLISVALLAVVGTVLGLVLVQRLGVTYTAGLEVARDSAVVAATGTAEVQQLAEDMVALTDSAATALSQAGEIVDSASASTEAIGTAMRTNLAEGIEGTANIANGMASFIERIERLIPGDSRSLAEDLRALSNGLEPLPAQLRTLGDQLVTTASQLQTSSADLDVLAAQLDVLAGSIGDAAESLSEVDALARDIAQRAEEALDRSKSDLLLLRLLVVVFGVGVMAACVAAHRAVGALAVRQAAEPPVAPAP